LTELMIQAGLTTHLDAAGTLIGRLEGPDGAPTLLMGSHQDSVREGGSYDGIMGVVLPVLALHKLRDDGVTLPIAVEVLAFADEEGVRFPTALLGPRALAGTFDMAALDMRDADNVSLAQAMRDFGLAPEDLPTLRRDPATVLGWVEVHLEQGPVLESAGNPLGVVTAICGIERHSVTLTGKAAHAGTMPMHLRQDALTAAAEFVLAVEALAKQTTDLLATIGTLQIRPGVVNAVPGMVTLSLEIRAPSDADRTKAAEGLTSQLHQIAANRGIAADIQRTYAQPATPCAAAMMAALGEAVSGNNQPAPRLASGATHDASAMADLCPVGMIFTTCKDGISHHPDEFVPVDAMQAAIDALCRFLTGWRIT
ncbi:MAG: M20 family metallo-hydrolase, partial [Loktanella sp.]|nr:M20 family metallo-hydrolase [Loktanella sp.]